MPFITIRGHTDKFNRLIRTVVSFRLGSYNLTIEQDEYFQYSYITEGFSDFRPKKKIVYLNKHDLEMFLHFVPVQWHHVRNGSAGKGLRLPANDWELLKVVDTPTRYDNNIVELRFPDTNEKIRLHRGDIDRTRLLSGTVIKVVKFNLADE